MLLRKKKRLKKQRWLEKQKIKQAVVPEMSSYMNPALIQEIYRRNGLTQFDSDKLDAAL